MKFNLVLFSVNVSAVCLFPIFKAISLDCVRFAFTIATFIGTEAYTIHMAMPVINPDLQSFLARHALTFQLFILLR